MEENVPVQAEREQSNLEMRNTPGPGSYEIPDFLTEWKKKSHSFRSSFMAQGRESPIWFTASRDGRYLAPGLYNYQDFVADMSHRKYGPTYGAKGVGREPIRSTSSRIPKSDYSVELGPGVYNTEKYLAIGNIPRSGPPMSMFRSQTPRFVQRVVSSARTPGPGNYSLPPMVATQHPAVTSSFTSKTARFKSPANKVPGPGTYDRCIQTPAAAESLTKAGKLYGLFFPIEYYP